LPDWSGATSKINQKIRLGIDVEKLFLSVIYEFS
jgi:hypothetical protein